MTVLSASPRVTAPERGEEGRGQEIARVYLAVGSVFPQGSSSIINAESFPDPFTIQIRECKVRDLLDGWRIWTFSECTVSCVPESVSWPDERGLCNCVITGLALRYVLYKSSFVAFLSQKWLICFEDEADSKVGDTFSCVVLDDKSWINQEKEKGQTFQHSLRLSPWDNLGISFQPNLQGNRKSKAQIAVGRMLRRVPCCLL